MAKKTDQPDAAAQSELKAAPQAATLNSVVVIMWQDMQCGDRQLKKGDKIATVILEPDVHLDYLAHARANGICGPAN